MKKRILTSVIAMVMVIATVFTLCACSANNGFMSDGERNKLVEKYGTPKATVTLTYTRSSKKYEIQLNYNLLLDKTPVSVVNFINLANKGYYDNTIVDTHLSSYTNTWLFGRYGYDSETSAYSVLEEQKAFAGEFVQNGYVLPAPADADEDVTDGNAQFSLLCLAMYHENDVNEVEKSFNSANGKVFITTSSTATENYKNYAVFAELDTVSVKVDDQVLCENAKEIPAQVLADFNGISGTKTVTVGEGDDARTYTVLSTVISVKVEIVDAEKYSDLPQNYVLNA